MRTRFDNMKFSDYVYREYPKHINLEGGGFKEVNNEREEREILEEETKKSSLKIVSSENAKNTLLEKAEKLGIPCDKRWGISKIEEVIATEEKKVKETI